MTSPLIDVAELRRLLADYWDERFSFPRLSREPLEQVTLKALPALLDVLSAAHQAIDAGYAVNDDDVYKVRLCDAQMLLAALSRFRVATSDE